MTVYKRLSTEIKSCIITIKNMTSIERRELRYQRRKAKRPPKKEFLNYDEIFTFSNLWKARQSTMKGVGWKASVQSYRNRSITNISRTYRALQNHTYKSKGFYEFDIIERGKPRHIKSVHISERVVQRCLCDIFLVPAVQNQLIYDNGACLKGKGIDFSLNRMIKHLKSYYRKYGSDGYALLIDFSKYFDNIDHDVLQEALTKIVIDKRTLNLLSQLIADFGDKGLGLGSQISQICAIFLPNYLDKFIKNNLKVKYYARYMDDSYLISNSKQYLIKYLKAIQIIAKQLNIKINSKKTQIVKIRNGIPWLKIRFVLTQSGKIYRKPFKKSITRMRRKLKLFRSWAKQCKMKLNDISTAYNSWKGHIEKSNSVKSMYIMDKLYNTLFKGEKYGNYNRTPVYYG